jgi:hypothetical protein
MSHQVYLSWWGVWEGVFRDTQHRTPDRSSLFQILQYKITKTVLRRYISRLGSHESFRFRLFARGNFRMIVEITGEKIRKERKLSRNCSWKFLSSHESLADFHGTLHLCEIFAKT